MSGIFQKQIIRVPAKFVLFSACTGLLVAIVSYIAAADIITEQTQSRMTFVAQEAEQDISKFVNERLELATSQSRDPNVISAIQNFRSSLKKYGEDWGEQLRADYGPGGTVATKTEGEKTSYDRMHAKFGPTFAELATSYRLTEVLLADPDGKVFYSTNMGPEVGESLALPAPVISRETLFASDLSVHQASGTSASQFIWANVVHYGDHIGTVIFRIDATAVVGALGHPAALGETGEVRLIDHNNLVLGISTPNGQRTQETIFAQDLDAATDFKSFVDPEFDRKVRGWVEPVSITELGWNILTLETETEVFAPLQNLVYSISGLMALILVGSTGLGFYFSRGIVGPITTLEKTMQKIASGKFDTEIFGLNRKDELGEMARAVEVFRENGLRVNQMTEE
ncbi:HAMP domain-containing protein, partial [Maritalea sp.]|uniref:HAMP domain-containing protein n=1 Tax=Maritalea sp. TaxID=2003361 RepID=UPI003EFA688C